MTLRCCDCERVVTGEDIRSCKGPTNPDPFYQNNAACAALRRGRFDMTKLYGPNPGMVGYALAQVCRLLSTQLNLDAPTRGALLAFSGAMRGEWDTQLDDLTPRYRRPEHGQLRGTPVEGTPTTPAPSTRKLDWGNEGPELGGEATEVTDITTVPPPNLMEAVLRAALDALHANIRLEISRGRYTADLKSVMLDLGRLGELGLAPPGWEALIAGQEVVKGRSGRPVTYHQSTPRCPNDGAECTSGPVCCMALHANNPGGRPPETFPDWRANRPSPGNDHCECPSGGCGGSCALANGQQPGDKLCRQLHPPTGPNGEPMGWVGNEWLSVGPAPAPAPPPLTFPRPLCDCPEGTCFATDIPLNRRCRVGVLGP